MNYDFYKVRGEIYVTSGNKTLFKMKYNTCLNIDNGTNLYIWIFESCILCTI